MLINSVAAWMSGQGRGSINEGKIQYGNTCIQEQRMETSMKESMWHSPGRTQMKETQISLLFFTISLNVWIFPQRPRLTAHKSSSQKHTWILVPMIVTEVGVMVTAAGDPPALLSSSVGLRGWQHAIVMLPYPTGKAAMEKKSHLFVLKDGDEWSS